MQSQNKFFDDLSRLATGAAGTMAGMGREMEGRMKERLRSRKWPRMPGQRSRHCARALRLLKAKHRRMQSLPQSSRKCLLARQRTLNNYIW